MKKYIAADKLRAEIEKYRTECEGSYGEPGDNNFPFGKVTACNEIIDFIDSLQQEQPEVDLEEEADRLFFSLGWYEGAGDKPMLDCISLEEFRGIAKRFFELGQKDAANKYDEIEYNRQRAEEESK